MAKGRWRKIPPKGQRRPSVRIEKALCSMCLRYGNKHTIVTGHIVGEGSGWRLTDGCKATFGVDWERITDRNERRPWVKKFWEKVRERGR